jgi:lipopolysaccharide/colanic/teichoic acid biosynthesis glycosyltransferase
MGLSQPILDRKAAQYADFACKCKHSAARQRRPFRGPSALYLGFGKRVLDTAAALAGLAIMSPLLLLCGAVIWLDSRGPTFYRQERVGQCGRPFRIIKLRTMIVGADRQGSKLTASTDRRITRVGSLLRRTKLDEIPQLLNVLKGEMSLVGPRPEVREYTARYAPEERRVLDLKPGITGLASLAYVDEERLLAACPEQEKEQFYVNTMMRRKLQVELTYRSKVSLFEDLKIIALTIRTVLLPRADDASPIPATPSSVKAAV